MIPQGKSSYDRNNNPAMVSDLLGDDENIAEGYGDEEDYGDETEYKGRRAENAYDFMWIITQVFVVW